MNRNRTTLSVLLAAAVLASARAEAQTNAAVTTTNKSHSALDTDLFPDPVIVKGTGFEIKRSQLDEAISGVRATAAARGRELSPTDLPLVEKAALDHLLQVDLLKAKATAEDKTKGAAEADKRIDIIKKRAPSEEALTRQLKLMNMTMETLRARLVEEATAEQVLRDKITVTDDQVKKYYEENPSQFEAPESVKVSHILISTMDPAGKPLTGDALQAKKKLADDILKQAKAGTNFYALVEKYSEDPGSNKKRGEYTFSRGQMVKEFEAAAFSMQTNQISDLVMTQYGYHIIKLEEKIPSKKEDFATVAPQIRNYLEGKAMEKILPATYAELKKEEKVEVLDDQLKTLMESTPMVPPPPTNAIPALPSPK